MISVLISTYGDEDWQRLARERAYPSAIRDKPGEVILHHDPTGTISTARNQAADRATGDWLCFLDADDELGPGYLNGMQRTVELTNQVMDTTRVLFTPMVSKVKHRRRERPRFYPEIPLDRANWLIIGTMIHHDFFNELGGFQNWPHGLEDWNLWSRAWKAGATVVKVKRALYLAHWNDHSKHHALMRNPFEHVYWHQKAGLSVWPDRYDAVSYEEDERRTLLDQGRPRNRLRMLAVDSVPQR